MHTIKGSAAMMGLDNMSTLSHAIEDMFYILRENKSVSASITHLYELVFDASDLLKAEVEMIQDPESEPTDFSGLKTKIKDYIIVLKNGGEVSQPKVSPTIGQAVDAIAQAVKPEVNSSVKENKESKIVSVRVFFEDGCQMENLRALLLVNTITDDCEYLDYQPKDIETNSDSAKIIIDDGFLIHFKAHDSTDLIVKHIE